MQMPSRARAGTAHEARLAYRAGPARQTGPRAVLVHRARHVGRPGPARLVIRANRAGPNRAGPDRARAGSGRARPVGQLYTRHTRKAALLCHAWQKKVIN